MKISELIEKLQYALDNSGDMNVCIGIDTKNKNGLKKHPKLFPTIFYTRAVLVSKVKWKDNNDKDIHVLLIANSLF